MNTRSTLVTYANRVARNKDASVTDNIPDPTAQELDNRVFLELADTFALAAQAGLRATELMLHLAALGEAGHETALLSFAALQAKDPEACDKAVKAFAMTRNKMVNPKQKAHDVNVERVWGETSIRMNKAGLPELYSPKRRNGSGIDQNATETETASETASETATRKRTAQHERAILRAWRMRAELREARAALQGAKNPRKRAKRAA